MRGLGCRAGRPPDPLLRALPSLPGAAALFVTQTVVLSISCGDARVGVAGQSAGRPSGERCSPSAMRRHVALAASHACPWSSPFLQKELPAGGQPLRCQGRGMARPGREFPG
jgi:hypothetical protein